MNSLFDVNRQRAQWEDEIESAVALVDVMSQGDTAELAMHEWLRLCDGSHVKAQRILVILRSDLAASFNKCLLLLELDKCESEGKP